jgi:hypothetical protein
MFLRIIDWCVEKHISDFIVEFKLLASVFKVVYANHSLFKLKDKLIQIFILGLEISALNLGIRHLLDCLNFTVCTLKCVNLLANCYQTFFNS